MGARSLARVVVLNGWRAYRGLFNWTHPTMFVCTLVFAPILQVIFLTELGRYAGVESDAWYVAGTALLGTAYVGVFGGTMAVSNERQRGTLGLVIATPVPRSALILGRGLPYVAVSLGSGGVVLLTTCLVFGVRPSAGALAEIALGMLATTLGCSAFGLALGAIGLRARDVFVISNVAVSLLLLLTGTAVPTSALPSWLQPLPTVLPITHGARAVRHAFAGAPFADIWPQLLGELAVATGYATAAVALVVIFENESRRSATLETA